MIKKIKNVFKKKEVSRDITEKSEESKNKKYYTVHIYEGLESTPRKIKQFVASRWVDESQIPYLYYFNPQNKKEEFLELFPQRIKDFVKKDKKTLEKELEHNKNKLKEEQKKEEPTVNFKDIEFKIKTLNAQIRALEYSNNSSYVSLDENNNPEFFFMREGSAFLPFKWDLDTKSFHIPTDTTKKSASISLRNKEMKHRVKNNREIIATYVLLAIALVSAIGFAWLTYKSVQTYSENEINSAVSEAITVCVNSYSEVVQNTQEQSQAITNIINELDKTTANRNINRDQLINNTVREAINLN